MNLFSVPRKIQRCTITPSSVIPLSTTLQSGQTRIFSSQNILLARYASVIPRDRASIRSPTHPLFLFPNNSKPITPPARWDLLLHLELKNHTNLLLPPCKVSEWPGDTVSEAWTRLRYLGAISVFQRGSKSARALTRELYGDEPRQRRLSSVKRVRAVGLDMRTRPKRAKRGEEDCVSAWRGRVGALERGLSGCLCVVASKARGLGVG